MSDTPIIGDTIAPMIQLKSTHTHTDLHTKPDTNKDCDSQTARKKRSTHLVISWTAVVIMAGFICWMSSNTGEDINQSLGIISAIKSALASAAFALAGHPVDISPVGHFLEYCVFGALLCNALRFHIKPRRAVAYAFLLGSLYGITDELHQAFVPTRSCDPLDWLVDTIASLVGALLALGILRWHAHRKAMAEREALPPR